MPNLKDIQDILERNKNLMPLDSEDQKIQEEQDIMNQLEENTLNPLIDKKEFNREINAAQDIEDSLQKETESALQEQTLDPIKTYEPVLRDYDIFNKLKDAQQSRKDTLLNAGLLSGANKISQGIARRYGAEVGAGDEYAKQIAEQADIPIKEIKELKDASDVNLTMQMDDPNSDISKFARQQAVSQMKRLNPDANVSLFESMSAAQLEKLGFKSVGSKADFGSRLRFERIRDQDGTVRLVGIDTITGEVVSNVGEAGFASQFRTDPRTGEIIGISPSSLGQAPINITGSKAKDDKNTSEKELTRKDLNPKERDLVDETRKSFTADPRYKNSQEAVDGSQNAVSLLESGKDGGQDLVRAIQTMLAKSSGQVGVLTEQDVAGFNGRADVISRLNRAISVASKGRLPEEDRKFLTSYAKTMQKAAQRNLGEVADLYQTQLSKDLGVQPKQAGQLLNVEQRISPKSVPAEEMIRVMSPEGKTGVLPKSKLEAAVKKGFKEIK